MAIIFAQAATRAISRSATKSGAPNPTGAPVLRGSFEEGTFEHHFWRMYQPRETDRLQRAARDVSRMFRRERRDIRVENGLQDAAPLLPTLTQSAVLVYEVLCQLGRTCKGEIYPSYAWLISKTDLSRATVARALKQLKEAGFLSIQRRCKRIEREGPGPRFEQTSNAYRLDWPARLAKWLGYTHAPCPIPDDEDHRQQENQQYGNRPARIESHNALDSALERLERALDKRESQKDTQPLLRNNNNNKKDERSWPSRPTRNP
jgi:DNA-binding transcriptional ArsR family regulator